MGGGGREVSKCQGVKDELVAMVFVGGGEDVVVWKRGGCIGAGGLGMMIVVRHCWVDR